MKKELLTLLGFILFVLGFLSILLSLVGVDLAFLLWMNTFGSLASFLIKILMIITGVIIVVLSRVDWENEEKLMANETTLKKDLDHRSN